MCRAVTFFWILASSQLCAIVICPTTAKMLAQQSTRAVVELTREKLPKRKMNPRRYVTLSNLVARGPKTGRELILALGSLAPPDLRPDDLMSRIEREGWVARLPGPPPSKTVEVKYEITQGGKEALQLSREYFQRLSTAGEKERAGQRLRPANAQWEGYPQVETLQFAILSALPFEGDARPGKEIAGMASWLSDHGVSWNTRLSNDTSGVAQSVRVLRRKGWIACFLGRGCKITAAGLDQIRHAEAFYLQGTPVR